MDIDLKNLKRLIANVETWIDIYIAVHREHRKPVSELGFANLSHYFSETILNQAYVVYTDAINSPPLAEFGLEDLAFFESLDATGITYKDTFFLKTDQKNRESIHFHELIHIIQWKELGAKDFIQVYGINLIEFGYRRHPLELIAYDLTADFDRDIPITKLEPRVRAHCNELAEDIRQRFLSAFDL